MKKLRIITAQQDWAYKVWKKERNEVEDEFTFEDWYPHFCYEQNLFIDQLRYEEGE